MYNFVLFIYLIFLKMKSFSTYSLSIRSNKYEEKYINYIFDKVIKFILETILTRLYIIRIY